MLDDAWALRALSLATWHLAAHSAQALSHGLTASYPLQHSTTLYSLQLYSSSTVYNLYTTPLMITHSDMGAWEVQSPWVRASTECSKEHPRGAPRVAPYMAVLTKLYESFCSGHARNHILAQLDCEMYELFRTHVCDLPFISPHTDYGSRHASSKLCARIDANSTMETTAIKFIHTTVSDHQEAL